VNWRALGCGVFAAAIFVGLGIFALTLALNDEGCPERLRTGPRTLRAEGPAAASPRVPGDESTSPPVEIGTTLGLTGRSVYVAADEAPEADASAAPDRLALDCGDGTFQGYVLEDGR
jgi:hypothetical protein